MKSWLQNRKLRKQRSEASLSLQRYDSIEADDTLNPLRPRPVHGLAKRKSVAMLADSGMPSRMSMQRYLSAPLSDEPASVPAITAALQKQTSHTSTTRATGTHAQHSRETSGDANSDGRRTFFTSGSAPDTVDTSYTTHQKANPKVTSSLPRSSPNVLGTELTRVPSPERPTTAGTQVAPADMAKSWAEQMEKYMPGYSSDQKIDYRAKAEQEIARIQERAKHLENMLKQFDVDRKSPVGPVTDEMAYARMAAQPKLAWILGADTIEKKTHTRVKSTASTTDDIPDRPKTADRPSDLPSNRSPRRSKSSGALDDKARQRAVERTGGQPTGVQPPERKPSIKRPKFYCTFCQKRFHSRLEWMRHEQTIHMPEELWICCPRTGEIPDRCPFCEKQNPSPSHLAEHNYLSCQGKTLSERTFGRKDHFLQHISQVHKVSPGQKPARLTELVEAWRHPLPLKEGHQALHCGFCGLTFPTYQDRTKHVSQHFMEGIDMMSWWKDRVSHAVQVKQESSVNPNPELPHQCAYCERTFENLRTAQKVHPVCSMWSCSFLPGMQYTIYPAGSYSEVEAVCCYCNDTLVHGNGKVKGSVLKDHIFQHNFRKCNQRLYFSGQRFRQHLQDSHKTTFDGTLFAGWTLLLKSSRKDKPAVFQQIPVPLATRRTNSSLTDAKKKKTTKKVEVKETPANFMDISVIPERSEPVKLRRKASTPILNGKPEPELRDSEQFFTRSATIDLAYGTRASTSPRGAPPAGPAAASQGATANPKPRNPAVSMPMDAIHSCPKFYRRRLDASTRNRVYMREREEMLSKNSQNLFRPIQGSALGGLVLHSSLIGAVPARLTNSIDVYSLH